MIDKEFISNLVNSELEGSPHYMVDVKVSSTNKISVILDSDEGLTIDQCVVISRLVESNLDREAEDFELNVMTYGIDHPLLTPRQYRKYIDKGIKLELEDGSKKNGLLLKVDEEGILFQPELPKSKTQLKKLKEEDKLERFIPYNEIISAKCLISFK